MHVVNGQLATEETKTLDVAIRLSMGVWGGMEEVQANPAGTSAEKIIYIFCVCNYSLHPMILNVLLVGHVLSSLHCNMLQVLWE